MRGLFKEQFEYYRASLTTKEGLFDYFIEAVVWGYLMVNYNDMIYNWVLSLLTSYNEGFLKDVVSYLIYGTLFLPIGLAITFVITKFYAIITKR